MHGWMGGLIGLMVRLSFKGTIKSPKLKHHGFDWEKKPETFVHFVFDKPNTPIIYFQQFMSISDIIFNDKNLFIPARNQMSCRMFPERLAV